MDVRSGDTWVGGICIEFTNTLTFSDYIALMEVQYEYRAWWYNTGRRKEIRSK